MKAGELLPIGHRIPQGADMKVKRTKRGFTLVETIIAVLLLATLATAASVSTTAILGTNNEMRMAAKAEVLCDEVLSFITSEMRFCENVTFNEANELVSYNSASYGEGTEITKGEDGKLYVHSAGMGTEVIEKEENKKEEKKIQYSPIGNTMYDQLMIKMLTFTKSEDINGIDVTVKIASGSKVLYTSSATIALLNV